MVAPMAAFSKLETKKIPGVVEKEEMASLFQRKLSAEVVTFDTKILDSSHAMGLAEVFLVETEEGVFPQLERAR